MYRGEIPIRLVKQPGSLSEKVTPTSAEEDVRLLLQTRPRSNVHGTFPRDMLPPGEAVLFETRPAFFPYASLALFGGGLIAIFGVFFYATANLTGTQLATLPGVGLIQFFSAILIAGGLIAIGASIIRWYYTSYAITSRRVAKKLGVYARMVVDARFGKIQSITMTETGSSRLSGYGNLLFSIAGQPWGGSIFSGLSSGGILWMAIHDPIEVRAFMERVSNLTEKWERAGTPLEILEE